MVMMGIQVQIFAPANRGLNEIVIEIAQNQKVLSRGKQVEMNQCK
jgi:hypothetical protein